MASAATSAAIHPLDVIAPPNFKLLLSGQTHWGRVKQRRGNPVKFDYKGLETRKIDKHGDLKWHSMDYLLS